MIPEVETLSPEEKLELADELLEDYYESRKSPEFDEAVGKLLDARMEEYRKNPDSAMTWSEFRAKVGLAE